MLGLHPGELLNVAALQHDHPLPAKRPEWYWDRLTGLSRQAESEYPRSVSYLLQGGLRQSLRSFIITLHINSCSELCYFSLFSKRIETKPEIKVKDVSLNTAGLLPVVKSFSMLLSAGF